MLNHRPPRWGPPLTVCLVAGGLLWFDYRLVATCGGSSPDAWPAHRLWLDHFVHVVGNGLYLGLLGAAIAVGGWFFGSRRAQVGGRWMVWAVVLAGFWAQVVKQLIGRPRPRLFLTEGLWWPGGLEFRPSWDSFPSGHSATLLALCPLLAWLCPRVAAWWLPLGCLLAVGRIYGGDHYPTDVLAGSLLGWQVGRWCLEQCRREAGDALD